MTKRVIGLLLAICCMNLNAFSQTTRVQARATPSKPKVNSQRGGRLPESPTSTRLVDFALPLHERCHDKRIALFWSGRPDALSRTRKGKTLGPLASCGWLFDLKLIRSRKPPTAAASRRLDRPIALEATGGRPWIQSGMMLDLTRIKRKESVREAAICSQVKIETATRIESSAGSNQLTNVRK